MKQTPLQITQERFGGDRKAAKSALIKAVKGLGSDLFVSNDAGKGIEHASNKKLLHLHDALTEVKENFGTRAKLIDSILEVEKRQKDSDYKTNRLEKISTLGLYDQYKASKKRADSKK